MSGSWGDTFQAEGRVYAKALRWEGALSTRTRDQVPREKSKGVLRGVRPPRSLGEDVDLNPENKGILLHGKCDVKGFMGLRVSSAVQEGVSSYLESSILTTLPSFMPWADITVLEECPQTICVFLFKGIFANMGSLGSWTRLRVSKAGPHGRGEPPRQCPGDGRQWRCLQLFGNAPFPRPAPVCCRVTLHSSCRH